MADENTVSIEAGSRYVYGNLTQFVGYPGDTFNCSGLSVPVRAVLSTSELELEYGWPGSTLADNASWTLQKTAHEWSSNVQIHKSVATLVQRVEGGLPVTPGHAAGNAAARGLYDDAPAGFLFVAGSSAPDSVLQASIKLSDENGDWSAWHQMMRGGEGPPGPPGKDGVSYRPDASGLLAERDAYDDRNLPFSYLATDEGVIYFRQGGPGGWSEGQAFPGAGLATKSEAEAGAANDVLMTPLRTDQYVTARIADGSAAEQGLSNSVLMTPLGVTQAIQAQVLPTRAQAMLQLFPAAQASVTTSGYATAGDGGGAMYKRVPVEPAHNGKFQSADGGWWEIASGIVNPKMFNGSASSMHAVAKSRAVHTYGGTGSHVVTVGSGGDFATINDALAFITRNWTEYTFNTHPFRIRLLSGFVMSEQVLVRGRDLSCVRITSDDPEVVIARSALVSSIDNQARYPAFGVTNGGHLPIIACLFNMDTSGDGAGRDGIYASVGSRAVIEENPSAPYGVKNAGGDGCSAQRNSHIVAHQTNFSGAAENGLHAGRTSSIDASLSNVSGAGVAGIYCWRNSRVDAYSSTNCSDCGQYGMHASYGGIITSYQANCQNAGTHGIYALNTGVINASQANCDYAGVDGVRAQAGSLVTIAGGTARMCGAKGLHALYQSDISAQSIDATGNIGNGVYAISAGININGGNARMGPSDATTDIVVQQGGIIRAAVATGGTNITKNTLASQGVIFG